MDPENPVSSRPLRVTVGDREVVLQGPREVSDPPGDRIYFWWGLTESALALAEVVTALSELDGKRALELGCGLGLPGLAAGLCGARVTFTDTMAEALEFARQNALRNGVDAERIDTASLDWTAPYQGPRFDLLLGAEILYDYYLHADLLRLFDRLLAPGAALLLADRPRLVTERFLGRLGGRGFEVTRRERAVALPDQAPERVCVYSAVRSA
jgi:predicted nicotinamide N-methyase